MGRQTRALFLPCKDKKHIFLSYEIVSFASREIKMGEAVKMSATAPVTSRDGCVSVSCLSCSFCLYFSTSSPDNTGFSAVWITGNPQDWEREAPLPSLLSAGPAWPRCSARQGTYSVRRKLQSSSHTCFKSFSPHPSSSGYLLTH